MVLMLWSFTQVSQGLCRFERCAIRHTVERERERTVFTSCMHQNKFNAVSEVFVNKHKCMSFLLATHVIRDPGWTGWAVPKRSSCWCSLQACNCMSFSNEVNLNCSIIMELLLLSLTDSGVWWCAVITIDQSRNCESQWRSSLVLPARQVVIPPVITYKLLT